MRKLHAVASLAFLLIVALACRRGEAPSAVDAAVVTSTPSVMTAADPASTAVSAPVNWKVGDTLDVEWSGTWYEAQILAVLPGPQYKIHYVGWGNNYDEAVGPSRMRARAGGAAPSSTAIATATTSAAATATMSSNASPFTAGCRVGWSKPRLEPGTECMQECANGSGAQETCPAGYLCKMDSKAWVSPHCDKKPTGLSAGCRPGWSRPMLDTECLQECTRSSNTRETCPEGLICTNTRMWTGPHCTTP